MAYNLGNTLRRLASRSDPRFGGGGWSLDAVRRDLLAIPGRLVATGHRLTLVLTAATATLWSRLWKALRSLRPVVELLVDSS